MDKDAIQTSHNYSKILDEHASGGYFSDAVKEAFEALNNLSDLEKRALFAKHFDKVFSRAKKLQDRVGGYSVDLSKQGLGIIEFYADHSEGGNEGSVGYRSLRVEAKSFTDHTQEVAAEHPRLWQRSEGFLHLDDNGDIDDAGDGYIDQALLHILDFEETLDVAIQTIQAQSRATTALGKTATAL